MKKILGSLVAIAAIWAGSTAIIGNQTEQALNDYIEKTNTLYASNGIKLNITEYQKSFLNSQAKIEVDFTDPALVALVAETYALPFKIDYNIEHGPLFFQNGLGLGLSKIDHQFTISSLFKGEDKKKFLELVKEDITVNTNMVISFAKNANYTIHSEEVNIKDNGKSVYISPFTLEGSTDIETLQGKGVMKIANIKLQEEGKKDALVVEDLMFDVNIDEFLEDSLMIGDIKFSIDKLILKDESNPTLGDIDIAVNGKMVTKKDSETTISSLFEGTVNLKDTKLPDTLPPLKDIHLLVDVEGIGTKGMIAFQKASQEMQKKQSALLSSLSNSSPKEMEKIYAEFGIMQQELISKLIHALNTLLVKDKTVITYAVDASTKDSKNSKVSASIGYTGDIDFTGSIEEITLKAQQQMLNLINLNLDIRLDKEHIKTLPNATELAQQIEMGIMQGFVKEEQGKYVLKGYYKNQELIVNDNNLTSTILPFIMMATQGGGF